MNTTQPKVQLVDIGGYKLPRYQLHLHNALGEFFLFPVLPSAEYLLAKIAPEYKEHLAEILDTPQEGYSIPSYQALFARSRMLTVGGGNDSFFDLVQNRLRSYKKEYERAWFDVPDQLQIIFESDSAPLEQVYLATVAVLTKNDVNSSEDEGFIEAVDRVIGNFIELLREDGSTGTGELRLLEQLYRKQAMFGNRILAIDLPLFMRRGDIEIDRILTSLLALGWSYEFDATYYKRSNEDVRELAIRFLRLYLAALTARVLMGRDDEASKYLQRKDRESGSIHIEDLTIENNDGSISQIQSMQAAFADANSEEAMLARDEVERLLPRLTDREREIATLISEGNTKAEVARMLGISDAGVGQTLKRIRERLKREV